MNEHHDGRLDDDLRRLVVALVAIDREVDRYYRKCKGLEPWTTFEAPAHLDPEGSVR